MSYASVAAHDAPASAQQPHPDPALFSTQPPTANNIVDDAAKINIVSPDFKENPATLTQFPPDHPDNNGPPDPHSKKSFAHKAEQESYHLWSVTKHYLFRPAVAGGLLGLLNVGLLSGAACTFYHKPHLRSDTRVIVSAAAAALALAATESCVAEQYLKTPAGQREQQRAKHDGAALYRHAREHILRPGVLGGLVGVLNAGILGTVGYFAYANWDRPHWDRRTVSAISVALFTLWSGEGYVAERYRVEHR